jgi:hypothetical protein
MAYWQASIAREPTKTKAELRQMLTGCPQQPTRRKRRPEAAVEGQEITARTADADRRLIAGPRATIRSSTANFT